MTLRVNLSVSQEKAQRGTKNSVVKNLNVSADDMNRLNSTQLNSTPSLDPTYRFVGNLFQAFVMYARLGLRGSRRFGLVLTGKYLTTDAWPETDRAVIPR